ncbi:response regulator transcription factor [Paracoccus caeni]|uniref:Response regulator transcription factor n=1 Tax=Paracoccus caeni TaxID=657651 RepID=A0A934SJF3_9RHOB|nr:response regulator transcription factor [Paracoccus caeni]MBK4218216.1 response regulator transcription factor [Paracoccus caeni]
MARILVIEDDPDIASVLMRGLGAAGHTVDWAETTEAATQHIAAAPCDAAIIDMMLGADSGADLLADLRAQGHRMPAIMLSALARVEDRAEGLEAGAQDYVVKPFQLSELLARLEVQLRRTAPRVVPVVLGGLTYDPATRTALGADRNVVMTEREGDLLVYLMKRSGTVLTRGEIFDAIWAPQGGSDNVVDVYLGYLRRKLAGFQPYGLILRTVRGRGFMLVVEDTE